MTCDMFQVLMDSDVIGGGFSCVLYGGEFENNGYTADTACCKWN